MTQETPAQIKCKNCGASIGEFSPYSTTIECPYCHESVINPLAISRIQEELPEKIIPFRFSEDYFSEFLIKQLIEGKYIPTDIFKKMTPGMPIQVYAPAYYFNGVYYCNWSCEVGISRTVHKSNNTTETVTDWHSESGSYAGNYEILQPMFSSDKIPNNAAFNSLTNKTINAAQYSIQSCDASSFDNLSEKVIILDKDADSTNAWNCAQNYLDNISHNAVRNHLRSKNIRSLRTNLVAAQPSSSLTLMPFFLVDYAYNGNTYYCSLDGFNDKYFSITTPEDKGISSQIHTITYILIAVILAIIGGSYYIYNYLPEINQDYLLWGGIGSAVFAGIVYAVRYFQIIGKYRKIRILEASALFPESEIVKEKLKELS